MKFTPSHKHTCPNCQQLFTSSELIEKPAKGSEKTIFYVHPDKHCPHCQQKLGQVWDKKVSFKVCMMVIFASFLYCMLLIFCDIAGNSIFWSSIIFTLLIGCIAVEILDRNSYYEKLGE